jgi:DUF4097 and DUF4098 domain-containing protein YvlB
VVATNRRGDITVAAGAPGTVTVAISGSSAADYVIDQVGDVITIEPRRSGLFTSACDLILTLPAGSTLELSSTSGDIVVQGEVEEMRASVASGDVRAGTIRSMCRVNSASGDITVGAAGDAEINTASGRVRLGRISGTLRLNAASGDVSVAEIGESANTKVASSTVRIDRFDGTELKHKSMSGDLVVGIPPRRTIDFDYSSLSGRLRNRLPKGDGSPSEKLVAISVDAVSGDVTLRGAGS